MNTELFKRLLPVKISFARGESPSPSKLNGIFNYIQASYFILESYLGNGVDYERISNDPSGRKYIHNIASAIGPMSFLYRPINKLVSIEHLHRNFGAYNGDTLGTTGTGGSWSKDPLHASHTRYLPNNANPGFGLDEYMIINDVVNIPVKIDNTVEQHTVYLYFKGTGSLKIFFGNGVVEESIACNSTDRLGLVQYTVPSGRYIEYLSLIPTANFHVYAITLASKKESYSVIESSTNKDLVFNVAFAMPSDNVNFWKILQPCDYAVAGTCTLATCSHCIGNTYDIFLSDSHPMQKQGIPICAGQYTAHLPASLHPKSTINNQNISYTNSNIAGTQTYTIQSCLLMSSKAFSSKFRPFAAFDPAEYNEPNGVLTKNESVVYDLNETSNPVKLNIAIRNTTRPDIVYVSDVDGELIPGETSTILIIGGAYNITKFMFDILKTKAIQETPRFAVYAD